ncbi:type ISP restriction/modification enzyme [Jiangella muralis]|uniref:type ISP restriction/modification enzyme n=1 Tax=Jiangella muralis TaxID=702383 RepID=UPI000B0818F6|nr:type ISP restriction/modification enzyme [Jiangella muralis]
MGVLQDYLSAMARIRETGEAVEETSYYGQLERLLNEVGGHLSPKVLCVLTTRNRGAGVPDGGFFLRSHAVASAGERAMATRVPERGVLEVKGPGRDVRRIARSQQVRKYLGRYGKVLVSTYREFLLVSLGKDGEPIEGELFSIAKNEQSFWELTNDTENVDGNLETQFFEFLARALLGDAPLWQPADLAWFLAAYAREGRRRLDLADEQHLEALGTLRSALEDGLGLKFEGSEGEKFFRSALVQTLFYGVFAAWVVWSESQPVGSKQRFSWRAAQWTLNVPMVRVLFQQLTTKATLPVGLNEVLDWTEDALLRVDRRLFFDRFESANAVQYFYEPFLQAYDPEMRRQLGVWYTPPEVVRHMVASVHRALKDDLGLELGLADENVHVLDPCTGTGSFLVETIGTIARVLEERHGDALVAQDTKAAALTRIHGFELLPAPFVIAHLNVGLALDRLGAPLVEAAGERASVYLTNALTGWVESDEHPRLPYPEFEDERDAAEAVKRENPILVVLGNPPYNGFAGVSGREEGGLVAPYKQGLADRWDITKNKLDDLYVRFFRVAERRITEETGRGIVCYITNFSWLADPSAVVMRRQLVSEFDRVYIENLNGDSRETGKKTPDGLPDPSIFSTRLNPAGIQVGTAISLLVRSKAANAPGFKVRYRDFWGAGKRAELDSCNVGADAPEFQDLNPTPENWYRLRPWSPRRGYDRWPRVVDLTSDDPSLGLNENRGEALISHDRVTLAARMRHYLDEGVEFNVLRDEGDRLTYSWARFGPEATRKRLLRDSPFNERKIVRFQVKPFDLRWAYIDPTRKLWNEPRPQYIRSAELGSNSLVVRRRAPRSLDGAAFLHSNALIDQHAMHKDAYVIPFWLPTGSDSAAGSGMLFELETENESGLAWRPNLSATARAYLTDIGLSDMETSQETASLIWLHALAVGYSPLYLEENGDAIRDDWPRLPLPAKLADLLASARLGQRIADLLSMDADGRVWDREGIARRRSLARIGRRDDRPLATDDGDLAVTAGWAVTQKREQQSGAVSRIVMPGSGRVEIRGRTEVEAAALRDEELGLLGAEVVDVYLNDAVCWRGVPEAAWDFKIGGYQVLRKWLSYRDKGVLGRDLTVAEAREFAEICGRLTELVLLGPELDANYRAATNLSDQEQDTALFHDVEGDA